MLQQHWHKHVIFIRTGFPFFSKSNFSNMQQFLEDGAGGCSLMRSFLPRLSDKPCCQGHATSYLHPSVLKRPCPQLFTAMKAFLIWHPLSHLSISPTTTLPCAVRSPAAARSPLPSWHIFFSLFPSKYWNLHGLPQNIAAMQRGCRQPQAGVHSTLPSHFFTVLLTLYFKDDSPTMNTLAGELNLLFWS